MKKILIMLLVMIFLISSCRNSDDSIGILATPVPTAFLQSNQLPFTGEYHERDLICRNFVQLRWGNMISELGSPHQFILYNLANGNDLLPPPILSSDGDIYIFDVVNRRVLNYKEAISPPEIIPVPNDYIVARNDYVAGTDGLYFGDIGVFHHTLIIHHQSIPYGRHLLGVIDEDGNIVREIELPFPIVDIISPVVQVDNFGNIYVPVGNSYNLNEVPWGLLQIGDFGFALEPEFINPRNYPSAIIGWDGYLYLPMPNTSVLAQSTLNIKYWEITNDPQFMQSVPENLTINFPEGINYGGLQGVDQSGRVYFIFGSNGQIFLARISRENLSLEVGLLPDLPEGSRMTGSVSPDGTFYFIRYNPSAETIQPELIMCKYGE